MLISMPTDDRGPGRDYGAVLWEPSQRSVAEARITGYAAWLVWRTFYLGRLQGLESKFRVIGDWAFGSLFERYTARLELQRASATAGVDPPAVRAA